jgi:7-carboxy-7-deazaguanine synthase
MIKTLPISEIFGPTIQGEGPFAGRTAWFIRLGGCNLACVWCDTPYTWQGSRYDLRSELSMKSVAEILQTLPTLLSIVVITGGEPLLYAKQPIFEELLLRLRRRGAAIHIETNGTIYPPESVVALLDVVVISPKLPSSQPSERLTERTLIDIGWTNMASTIAYLKIVCESKEDVKLAALLASRHGFSKHRTWVMPQARTVSEHQAAWPHLTQAAIDEGLNATARLHVLAWGDTRGN